jgi:hypothetical protein
MVDSSDVLLAIVSGPGSALIGSFVAYKLAIKQNKKEAFAEYFRELNGILDRILRKGSIKHFRQIYDSANNSSNKSHEEIRKILKTSKGNPEDFLNRARYLLLIWKNLFSLIQ